MIAPITKNHLKKSGGSRERNEGASEGGVESGMLGRSFAYAVVVACTSAAALPIAHAQTRATLELFTSQGCSSCPTADRLLGELATDPSLVTLTLPIDYWDYLGWKDTLADPRHTARQRGYSKVRGDREVYTPQVVVNGSFHVIGSDKSAIERTIAKSRQNDAVLSLPVTLSVGGGRLFGTVGEHGGTPAVIWVVGLAKAVTVAIKRGENKGKTITYHNVARSWFKVDAESGKTFAVPLKEIDAEGVDSAAVIVQSGTAEKPGPVLAAAMAALR